MFLFKLATGYYVMAIEDINGDNKDDLFFEIPFFNGSDLTGKWEGIAINQGNGNFITGYIFSGNLIWNNPQRIAGRMRNIVFTDIDGDNYKEIFVPFENRGVLIKNNGGKREIIKTYEVPQGISELNAFVDIDGNGQGDMFYVESGSNAGFIIFDNGSKISFNMPGVFIDVDKDGDKDFVYFDNNLSSWCVETNSDGRFGGVDFASCNPITVDIPLTYYPFEWGVYDFDGDGNEDFYVVEVDTSYLPYGYLKVFYGTYHNP